MPEMSGDQLATAIKILAPDVPVIMLTGFGEMMVTTGEQPPDVDLVISKPFTMATLSQALATVRAQPRA